MKNKCCIKNCKREVEFDIPNYLCQKHWQMWWEYKIKVPEKED